MDRHGTASRVLITLASCTLALGCSRSSDGVEAPSLVERARLAMGSELRLTAWTADEPAALEAFDLVFAEFDRLDQLMSVWHETSDVSRINAAAGDHAVAVSPEVREVLTVAREVSTWTGGKFDVTFGALSDIWKFDHDQDNRVPTREAILERLPLVDYTAVVVDDEAGTVYATRKGMRVHLGGIGKGYAVDRGTAILRAHGIHSFMVQSGGDLYVGGTRGDRPWRLGINDPRGAGGESFGTVELTDATFSTSGDYERFFMKNGQRYHHLLDPDTGEPARGARSVTIVSKQAVLADALSTGIFILGPTAGMELVERLAGVDAVMVTADNRVLVSSGLRNRFELLSLPSDAE